MIGELRARDGDTLAQRNEKIIFLKEIVGHCVTRSVFFR